VLRSIAKSWDNLPSLGKGKQEGWVPVRLDFRGFARFSRFGTALVRKRVCRRTAGRFQEEEMIASKMGQHMVAALAAGLFTVTAVSAAVGPVHGAARTAVAGPAALVAAQLSSQA
jgi:hypothetical protein